MSSLSDIAPPKCGHCGAPRNGAKPCRYCGVDPNPRSQGLWLLPDGAFMTANSVAFDNGVGAIIHYEAGRRPEFSE